MGCCDDLTGAAIAERHRGGEFDLVALCVVWNRGPVPTPLPSSVGVAVGVFQLGQQVENTQRRAGLAGASAFFHVLVAPASVVVPRQKHCPKNE